MRRFAVLFLFLALALAAAAQQAASPAKSSAPASANDPQIGKSNQEFLKAADEVLTQMSQLLDLPIKEPLKKSLRSKQEIRDYLIREEKEDLTDDERYADEEPSKFSPYPQRFPARFLHARRLHRPGRRPLRSQSKRILHRRLDSRGRAALGDVP